MTPGPKPPSTGLPATGATASDSPEAVDSPAAGGFPIVGIGASAGGLAAFEAFFSGMPKDRDLGMALVLVQHLAPDHKSLLSDLIQRFTSMQVFEVEDGMVVAPNCAYIIPPNRDMALANGTLRLLEPVAPRGQRMPIDFFFRSLAQDRREQAIGIVLSGTGSDGALGIRAIKGEGGMAMAQLPASCEFDGMPRSAIATGLVDYELPPAEMPAQLITYAAIAFAKATSRAAVAAPHVTDALKQIFQSLRSQTGHDFSQYKPSTILRRIERRMAVHQVDAIQDYARYLQQTPTEAEALFRDLLIGVTNFFRDTDAFQVLEEQVIPKLFEDKPAGATIRVWVAGCSTGEEAYSIAILLHERMETLRQSYNVQVFATDIDSRAISAARAGVYPASIATDLTPERLARFFTAEPGAGAYRIHKGIRDLLVFSQQDIIKDPPFSRLDLISCRNLMIYLGAELQQKLIPLFHYALNPGGMLFLGTSEGVGEFSELFAVLDRKAKLYRRKEVFNNNHRVLSARPLATTFASDALLPRPSASAAAPAKVSLRELTEQAIVRQVAPAAVLVDARGDVLYMHGRTGMFLEPTPGEAGVSNVLKMAREGLRTRLTAALFKAAATLQVVRAAGVRVKTNGHYTATNLAVHPITSGAGVSPESPLFLVILEQSTAPNPDPPTSVPDASPETDAAASDARIVALRQELLAKEESLQRAIEELESSTEELKSSNEEMQSVNEELQSTNEELETSKEELQSVNEELATVNAELQAKVLDLSRSNNDMNNLLAGTGVGTVFVDHQLRVMRFTPAASQVINLIQSDVGRPVTHIVSNLVGYDRLADDLRSVLDTLVPKEMTVQTTDGKWYTMRVQPYRTMDNVIEGAVVSFVDVSEIVQARESLRKANENLSRLAIVVRDAHDAITVQDLEGRVRAWNPAAERMYGWTEAEALALDSHARIPSALQGEAITKMRQLCDAERLEPFRTQRLTRNGEVVDVWVTVTPLVDESGQTYAIATTERLCPVVSMNS